PSSPGGVRQPPESTPDTLTDFRERGKTRANEKRPELLDLCVCWCSPKSAKSRGWWSQGESNPRPLECHSSALPTELWPLRDQYSVIRKQGVLTPDPCFLIPVILPPRSPYRRR